MTKYCPLKTVFDEQNKTLRTFSCQGEDCALWIWKKEPFFHVGMFSGHRREREGYCGLSRGIITCQ